ncbi:MAG: hypothetical protein ACXIT9_00430 [Nitritalea sp.]
MRQVVYGFLDRASLAVHPLFGLRHPSGAAGFSIPSRGSFILFPIS